ncbi:MAG: putative phage tail protein [Bacteroidales bacterium]
MTKKILASSEGKRIINYISPVYSNGPVAVSVIQAIGKKLDDLEYWVQDFSIQANPKTATWALNYWEQEYGIGTDETLSYEQRRNVLLAKIMLRSPMTPWRIETMLANIFGREIKVLENTGPYRFAIEIYPGKSLLDYYKLMQILNNCKPACLCYDLFITTPVMLKVSIQTEVIPFEYFMTGTGNALCGGVPFVSKEASLRTHQVQIKTDPIHYYTQYDMAGTVPFISKEGQLRDLGTKINAETTSAKYDFAMTNVDRTGIVPDVSNQFQDAGNSAVSAKLTVDCYRTQFEISGFTDTGVKPDVNIQSDLNQGGVGTDIETQAFFAVYPVCGENDCGGNG